jgi:hypothetical protein
MKIFTFILFVLAIWRITHMLQSETGPMAIFAKLQQFISNLNSRQGGIREMFYCFNCLSIWISIPFAVIYGRNNIFEVFVSILALSAGAILFDRLTE